MYEKYREPIVYVIVGVIVTAVDYLVYSIFVKYLGFGVTPANIIAWIAAVLVAYILNRRYVFLSTTQGAANIAKELFNFTLGRLFSGAVVIALVPLLMYLGVKGMVFGVEGFVAKFVASIIGLTLNYFFSKFIVFKKK